MTVKKNPTAEQLNEFRKLIGLASSDADLDNINAFIEENGKKGVKDGVKGYIDAQGQFTIDEVSHSVLL